MKSIKNESKTLVAKGPNNAKKKLKKWHKRLLLILTPITIFLIGIFTLAYVVLWYSPVVPPSKRAVLMENHLFLEGNTLYSYSTDTNYEVSVIYDQDLKSGTNGIKFEVKPNKEGYGEALRADIPLNVNNVEIVVKEKEKWIKHTDANKTVTYTKSKKDLKSNEIHIHKKADTTAKWLFGGKDLSAKTLEEASNNNIFSKEAKAKIIDLNLLEGASLADKAEMKEESFIKAIFVKKTISEVINSLNDAALSHGKISNNTVLIDKAYWDDKKNDPMTRYKVDKFVDGKPYYKQSPHSVFWHATADGPFKGLEGKVAGIEKDVMTEVNKFEYNGKHLWLVKSNPGTSPTLGVKFGLLLARDGYSFAGIPINGKSWMKDMGISAAPAGDTLGIYTVLVLDGVTSTDISTAKEIASKIGGVN